LHERGEARPRDLPHAEGHPRVRRSSRLLAAAVVVLCAEFAQAGWWDDAGAARATTVAEIRRDPDRWRDVVVLLEVRFARVEQPGTPYFTRFTARDWRALCAFPGDATDAAVATEQPFPHLF